VWVESTAVGIQMVSTPAAEIIGNATVSEHLPKPEISLIATSLFWFSIIVFLSLYKFTLPLYNNFGVVKSTKKNKNDITRLFPICFMIFLFVFRANFFQDSKSVRDLEV
jgi:cytosine/uracil/thiamine/allantoin permease